MGHSRRGNLILIALAFLGGWVVVAAQERGAAVKDDDFNRTFNAGVETVFRLAVQTAASNWHLQTSDKDAYTLAFNTGRNMRTWSGFDMSAACIDLGDGRTRVTVHPQRRKSGQLFSWKEGNRASDSFLDRLAEAVKNAPVEAPARDATGAPATSTTVEMASVEVTSEPAGADIFVDGKFFGNTPSELRLEPGEHGVRVQKAGYLDWERIVTVAPAAKVTLTVTLSKPQ